MRLSIRLAREVKRRAAINARSHAGWRAIHKFWEINQIEDVLVHKNANTEALALQAMQEAADDIVKNSKERAS